MTAFAPPRLWSPSVSVTLRDLDGDGGTPQGFTPAAPALPPPPEARTNRTYRTAGVTYRDDCLEVGDPESGAVTPSDVTAGNQGGE